VPTVQSSCDGQERKRRRPTKKICAEVSPSLSFFGKVKTDATTCTYINGSYGKMSYTIVRSVASNTERKI